MRRGEVLVAWETNLVNVGCWKGKVDINCVKLSSLLCVIYMTYNLIDLREHNMKTTIIVIN